MMRTKSEQTTGGRAAKADSAAAAGRKRKAEPEKQGPKRSPLAGLSRAKRRRIEQERQLAAEGGSAREAAARAAVRAAKKAARPVRMSQFGDGEQLRPTAGQLARAKRLQEKERKSGGGRGARSGKRRPGNRGFGGGGGGGGGGFDVDLGSVSRRGGGRGPKGREAAEAGGGRRAGGKPGGGAAKGLKVANKRTNKNAKKARERGRSR